METRLQNWLLQTLSDIINDRDLNVEQNLSEKNFCSPEYFELAQLKARREWFSSIAAIEKLLLELISEEPDNKDSQGLILTAPTPVISNPCLTSHFKRGIFTIDAFNPKALMPCRRSQVKNNRVDSSQSSLLELPLIPNDPIAKEQFCLIFTKKFSLVVILGKDINDIPTFHFSFEPEIIEGVWLTLRSRLVLLKDERLTLLDTLVARFVPPIPCYRLVSSFSRELLKKLPDLATLAIDKDRQVETIDLSESSSSSKKKDREVKKISVDKITNSISNNFISNNLEMELLQALTHEIRTPLTTIRTLTRLLLKKKEEFSNKVLQRLQTIDRECTEQIERMELIFRAVELESKSHNRVSLTPCCLERLLQQTIPRWEKQAQRRNINLDVTLPQTLPVVVSDPAMLDRVLTSLIENCTRSLPSGGKILIRVSTAGDRLKLQVISQYSEDRNPLKALGQLLMFQPETGFLGLNLDVTKNMFQALGGKLTVRKRPSEGEELTVFLPLGNSVVKV